MQLLQSHPLAKNNSKHYYNSVDTVTLHFSVYD